MCTLKWYTPTNLHLQTEDVAKIQKLGCAVLCDRVKDVTLLLFWKS